MARDEQSGSTLPRRQLGRALREARQAVGFTLEQAAQEMEMSKTSVIRIEKGHNEKVRLRDVEGFGQLYELTEKRIEELKALAQQSATKSWWQASRHLLLPGYRTYLGLESAAAQLFSYQQAIIPGLLQIAQYSRAIERPLFPSDTPEDLESRVAVRLRRKILLTRKRRALPAEFVLHEAVLHTVVGSHEVMAAQLRHIADIGTYPGVTVHILPFEAGFPGEVVPVLPYVILDFPAESAEPSIVFCEQPIGAMFFEEDADVKRYRGIHEALRCATLDAQRSRDLLRQMARRYEQ
ncbi:helix-turn-helix domain-containing protein [Nocardia flavorosea]|uniref:Helix-turn-helix domain-containing protein n=1 Tax=Nocardia flavorosea TaxID=53429 RepID=A0A846YLZ8_9NOCA|nr:helix-turn-helix transcriptional regulator [Nocardia flavorosea]NKY58512.1 helix-turn-helix domain-containing protein [Nocardia flavorosea]